MYFIQGIPFTFDDVESDLQNDPYVNIEAENTTNYTSQDLYNWSRYLMEEECHPLLFPIELENPEALPQD
jgi:hypothetical protein